MNYDIENIDDEIINALKKRDMTARELSAYINEDQDRIITRMRHLRKRGMITVESIRIVDINSCIRAYRYKLKERFK